MTLPKAVQATPCLVSGHGAGQWRAEHRRYRARCGVPRFVAGTAADRAGRIRFGGGATGCAGDPGPLAGAPVRCVSHGEFIPRINLVERVCSHAGESAGYDALASRIATHLGWVAVEEQAERQVWPLTVMAEGTVALVR